MNNPKLKPALIGGTIFGVLSMLPYVQLINAACCALFIGGGMLAVYLYLKDAPQLEKTPYGDGAAVGALAGLFGAVAATLTAVVLGSLGVGEERTAEMFAMFEEQGTELPEFVLNVAGASGVSIEMVLAVLVVTLLGYGIFATIGGLLGAAIFRK